MRRVLLNALSLDGTTRVNQPARRRSGRVSVLGSPIKWLAFAATLLLVTATVPFLSESTKAAGAATPLSPKYAVGVLTDTFVDSHRTTPAWNGSPQLSTRTLVTTILYPASGPTGSAPAQGAAPEKASGPYPLIVFAHGLGGTPQGYMNVLAAWASEGFVVAAPLFPLSNGNVAGGPDAGDVVNQPKDMSFVIGAVLADSRLPRGVLSGLVNPDEIGAAGHSNGAVTTLGLVANTCCYDSAVKAAVVMAGTTEGFPPGHYDFAKTPPLLLVHGTADQLIPYRSAPLIYNQIRGPKGLLTLVGGSHDAAGGQDPRSAATVIRTTTDFFEAYLAGNRQTRSRLATDVRSPTTKIVLDLAPGSREQRSPSLRCLWSICGPQCHRTMISRAAKQSPSNGVATRPERSSISSSAHTSTSQPGAQQVVRSPMPASFILIPRGAGTSRCTS